MAQIGDILRFTQYFEQNGNQAVMVSFWKVVDDDGVGNLLEAYLARDFHKKYGDTIVPFMLHNTAKYTRTVCDNLSDPSEFFGEWVQDRTGGDAGQPLAPFIAASVKQSMLRKTTRAGYKRHPFLSENRVDGNNIVLGLGDRPALEGFWGDVKQMQNPIDNSLYGNIAPVVIGRIESPPDSGNYILDLSKVNEVVSASAQGVTSQNSRKVKL